MPAAQPHLLSHDFDEEPGEAMGPGLWDTFRRFRWLLGLFTLAGVGLGYLAFMKQDPKFVSTARMRVEQDVLPDASGARGGDGRTMMGTRMGELTSQAVLGPAIVGHNLAQIPELADEPSVMGAIASRLELDQLPDSDILMLAYYGEDPDESKVVLEAVTDSFQKYLTGGYGQKIEQIVELLRQNREELDADLTEMRAKYHRLREDSPLVREGNRMVSPHEGMMQQYAALRNAKRVQIEQAASRIDYLNEKRADADSAAALALLVDEFRQQEGQDRMTKEMQIQNTLFPTMLEEAELAERLGDEHPKLRRLRARIAATEEHLSEMLGADAVPKGPEQLLDLYIQKLTLEVQSLGAEAEGLAERYEEERQLASADVAGELELNTLLAEITEKEAMYTVIRQRLEELSLTPEDVKGYNVRLLSHPAKGGLSLAAMPLFVGAGGAVGFLLGFGLAFLLAARDDRFKDSADIQAAAGCPVIGHTPTIPASVKAAAAKVKRLPGADDAVVGPIGPTVLTVHRRLDEKGEYNEALRGIRASLFFGSRGKSLTRIQITSPNPEDGKSTTAANLAVTAAGSGKKVVLVDCDLRKPTAHKLFGIDPKAPGVVDILTGKADPDDAFRAVGVPNLTVLPRGANCGNAAELLHSEAFEHLLDLLEDEFDLVIIDTPPVLAVSDPLTVAPLVGGVVLVLRLDPQARGRLRKATTQLEMVGAPLAGVVITGVDAGASGYGSYAYDSYGGYAYGVRGVDHAAEKKYAAYRTAEGSHHAAPRAVRNLRDQPLRRRDRQPVPASYGDDAGYDGEPVYAGAGPAYGDGEGAARGAADPGPANGHGPEG